MQQESSHAGETMNIQTPATGVGHAFSDESAAEGGVTGDDAVDEALRLLPGLDARPVHEHAAVIESVHGVLRDRLADEPVDDEPGEGQG